MGANNTKLRSQQGQLLLRLQGKDLLQAPLLGLEMMHLSYVSSHNLPSVTISVSKYTSHTGLRLTLMVCVNLITLERPISKYGHILRY